MANSIKTVILPNKALSRNQQAAIQAHSSEVKNMDKELTCTKTTISNTKATTCLVEKKAKER